jgi:hypothetical protein
MTENQTPVETEPVTKINLKAIADDLGIGAALDVGIHSALEEAHKPKDPSES